MVTLMIWDFLRFSVRPYKTLHMLVFLPFCLASTVVLTFAGKAGGHPIQGRIVQTRGSSLPQDAVRREAFEMSFDLFWMTMMTI